MRDLASVSALNKERHRRREQPRDRGQAKEIRQSSLNCKCQMDQPSLAQSEQDQWISEKFCDRVCHSRNYTLLLQCQCRHPTFSL